MNDDDHEAIIALVLLVLFRAMISEAAKFVVREALEAWKHWVRHDVC